MCVVGYKTRNHHSSFLLVKLANLPPSLLILSFKGSIVFDGGVEGFVERCSRLYHLISAFPDVLGAWLASTILGCLLLPEMIFDGFSAKLWIPRLGAHAKPKVVPELGALSYTTVPVYRVDLGAGGVAMPGIVKSILTRHGCWKKSLGHGDRGFRALVFGRWGRCLRRWR